MRKALLIFVSLLLLFPVQSFAQKKRKPKPRPPIDFSDAARPIPEWMRATSSSLFIFEYNTRKVTRTSGTVRAWIKQRPSLEGHVDEKARKRRIEEVKSLGFSVEGYSNWAYTLELYEFDCAGNRYKTFDVVDYSYGGEVISSYSRKAAEWQNTIPGSVAEGMQEAVCLEKYLDPPN